MIIIQSEEVEQAFDSSKRSIKSLNLLSENIKIYLIFLDDTNTNIITV